MPHLIDTYATASGFKISSPKIYESYFPLPFKKYVLIHSGGGQPAKIYDNFLEVVEMIGSTLRENGYELIQIGGKDDQPIANTIDLRGKTNIHQTGYLVKRASLLVANDSCNIHFASGFDTPLIGLYGSTCPANHGPYFGDKSKQIILEADRKGNKPSFSREENPKTVNLIKPEMVAQAVFDALSINKKVNIETLHIGPQYNSLVIELVMDAIIKPEFFQGSVFNARMDYLFNEDILFKNLSLRPLCILTNKPLNINFLRQLRKHVVLVIYDIDESFSIEFVKQMLESAIPYQMTSFLTGEELNNAKLQLFDYGIILPHDKTTKESLENHEKYSKDTMCKTHKFLLSENKVYLNKGDWFKKKPVKDFLDNKRPISLDDPDFWLDKDWLYIFNETF